MAKPKALIESAKLGRSLDSFILVSVSLGNRLAPYPPEQRFLVSLRLLVLEAWRKPFLKLPLC